mmetsp:Transcript_18049/g.54829  ORF Transcript_18049/g.54829 Transcript_18049/m.54829 type:complete len:276 (-) Transcript_18049:848-1675(-)
MASRWRKKKLKLCQEHTVQSANSSPELPRSLGKLPLVLGRPPGGQGAAVDARRGALAEGRLPEDKTEQPDKLLLEGPPVPVKGGVSTGHEHADAVCLHEVLWVRDDARLAHREGGVAVHPLGDGHARLVDWPVRLGGIHQLVDQVPLHEDLQEVPRLAARAGLASELRDVEAVLLGGLDDGVGQALDLALGHVALLQQGLQHGPEGEVLAAVACDEDHRHASLGPRRSQGAHHGKGHPAEAGVVVALLVRKLRAEPLHQGPGIRYLIELVHQDAR